MRNEEKLTEGSLYWTMDFDLTNRAMHVYFRYGNVADQVPTPDGHYSVDIDYIGDLPIVLGLDFLEPNKVSIIQDWIEEAIEQCMNTLNVCKGDDFAADHFTGVMQHVEKEDGPTVSNS